MTSVLIIGIYKLPFTNSEFERRYSLQMLALTHQITLYTVMFIYMGTGL